MSAGAELVQLWSVGRQDLEDVPPTSHVVIVKTLSDVRPHTHTQRPHYGVPAKQVGHQHRFLPRDACICRRAVSVRHV